MDILEKAKTAAKVLFSNFSPEQITELKTALAKLDAAPVDPAVPAATPQAYMVNVTGGSPIHTDISDDGIEGLDANDAVFTDTALTIPYPDGTYTLENGSMVVIAAGLVVSVSASADPSMTSLVQQMEVKMSAYKSDLETKYSSVIEKNKVLESQVSNLYVSVKLALSTIDKMLEAPVNTVDFSAAKDVAKFDRKLSETEYSKLNNKDKELHNRLFGRP